jgi:hypothetical protein
VLLRAAKASLERGLPVNGGVSGPDIDGGSEARESRMPAILKRSEPRSLRNANTVVR